MFIKFYNIWLTILPLDECIRETSAIVVFSNEKPCLMNQGLLKGQEDCLYLDTFRSYQNWIRNTRIWVWRGLENDTDRLPDFTWGQVSLLFQCAVMKPSKKRFTTTTWSGDPATPPEEKEHSAKNSVRWFSQELRNLFTLVLTSGVSDNIIGVIHNEGPAWQEQRRFTLRHLRDLGFGRTSSEGLIQEEIDDLRQEIMAKSMSNPNGSVNFQAMFNSSLVNILWALIAGERFKRDDGRLGFLLDLVENFIRSGDFTRANIPVPGFLFRVFPKLIRKFLGLRNDLFTPLQDFVRVITYHCL